MALTGVHGVHGVHSVHGVHGVHGVHDVHAGGPGGPLLSAAIGIASEGVMQRWDGTADYKTSMPQNLETRLRRLEPSARRLLLAHEAGMLFKPDLKTDHKGTLRLGNQEYLTLHFPLPDDLSAQIRHLRTAVDLRSDRLPEIIAQQSDMLSFFGAVLNLHADRTWWTGLLLSAIHDAVLGIEMRFKFHANLPRPIDFSPNVCPVIQTPAHSTYPSGHATEAFAIATVLSGVRLAGSSAANPVQAILEGLKPDVKPKSDPKRFWQADFQLFKLAHRIADNRTVAGVHFPVDGAHGALLGLAIGLGFVGHLALTPNSSKKLPGGWNTGEGSVKKWTKYFALPDWRAYLDSLQAPEVDSALPQSWIALPEVWKCAAKEWEMEELPQAMSEGQSTDK